EAPPRGTRAEAREGDGLLLRGAGQGVGPRPRRGAVGGLHRPRRCARRPAPRAGGADRGGLRVRRVVVLPLLIRRATAEFVGTAGLVCAVVGSGIAAQRLSPSDVGLQLLENSTSTAAALVALLLAFGSVSGAHFNPAVTGVEWARRRMTAREATVFVPAQVVGGA